MSGRIIDCNQKVVPTDRNFFDYSVCVLRWGVLVHLVVRSAGFPRWSVDLQRWVDRNVGCEVCTYPAGPFFRFSVADGGHRNADGCRGGES